MNTFWLIWIIAYGSATTEWTVAQVVDLPTCEHLADALTAQPHEGKYQCVATQRMLPSRELEQPQP